MTDEDIQKLRDELDASKAANAFLYLALEEVAKLTFDMPTMMMEQHATGTVPEEKRQSFKNSVNRLEAMLKNAHDLIWDEDGKPR